MSDRDNKSRWTDGKIMSVCVSLAGVACLAVDAIQGAFGWLPMANSHLAQSGAILISGIVVAVVTNVGREFL